MRRQLWADVNVALTSIRVRYSSSSSIWLDTSGVHRRHSASKSMRRWRARSRLAMWASTLATSRQNTHLQRHKQACAFKTMMHPWIFSMKITQNGSSKCIGTIKQPVISRFYFPQLDLTPHWDLNKMANILRIFHSVNKNVCMPHKLSLKCDSKCRTSYSYNCLMAHNWMWSTNRSQSHQGRHIMNASTCTVFAVNPMNISFGMAISMLLANSVGRWQNGDSTRAKIS